MVTSPVDIDALEALASDSEQAVARISGRLMAQIAEELRRGRAAMALLKGECSTSDLPKNRFPGSPA